jgi:hypothetical protein
MPMRARLHFQLRRPRMPTMSFNEAIFFSYSRIKGSSRMTAIFWKSKADANRERRFCPEKRV